MKYTADHRVHFDPNIGLVLQNYFENKARFLSVGNDNEEGVAFMEMAVPTNYPITAGFVLEYTMFLPFSDTGALSASRKSTTKVSDVLPPRKTTVEGYIRKLYVQSGLSAPSIVTAVEPLCVSPVSENAVTLTVYEPFF